MKKCNRLIWWGGVGGVCVLHILLLLLNFARVPVTHGYDWAGHLTYLYYVAENWQTPPASVSPEFFNPLVYYFGVAAFHYVTGIELGQAGQVFNLLLAFMTLGLLVGLCHSVWREQIWPILWWIGFYVCNPTVYRAFGMVRPEAMLIPLFVISGWLVIEIKLWEKWVKWVICSALLAGLAWGVRQWGIFLEGAFLLWMVAMYLQERPSKRWIPWAALISQLTIFMAMLIFSLVLRGGNLLDFNAQREQIAISFLTRLELPTLFSNPVRPNLNYRFWPVLYADFWGDYWRYWREALEADVLSTSLSIQAALSRAMWVALPATGLTFAGFLYWERKIAKSNYRRMQLGTFSRLLVGFSMVGFLIFASLYAYPGKGDTVKSVYIVYLIPFLGYLGSNIVYKLTFSAYKREGALFVISLMVLMLVFVMPNGIYLPPDDTTRHIWSMPQVSHCLDVRFGDAISLVGYDWKREIDASGTQFSLTLVWRSDSYTEKSYKVFVHYVDSATGQLLDQSDAVPSDWTHPTQEWKIGEYVVDTHILTLPTGNVSGGEIRVGLYDAATKERLMTTQGKDYLSFDIE